MTITATTSTAPAATEPANILADITRFLGNVVHQFHSEAALVLAVLSGMGITPHSNNWTTGILAAYAALTKSAATVKA